MFYLEILEDFESRFGKEYIVTEEDINEYFSNLLYLIEDEEELEAMNKAEEYIRFKANIS